MADLISAGLIKAPTRASLDYGGTELRADVTAEGVFEVNGKPYSSPSTAAGYAIADALKRTTFGRKYLSVNGWKVWRIVDASGRERSLMDIRADLDRRSRGAR